MERALLCGLGVRKRPSTISAAAAAFRVIFSVSIFLSLELVFAPRFAVADSTRTLWKGEFALTPSSRKEVAERFLHSDGSWNVSAMERYHQEIQTRLHQIKSLQKPISLHFVRAYEILDRELLALRSSSSFTETNRPVPDHDLSRALRILEIDHGLKSFAPLGPAMRAIRNFSATQARWTIFRGVYPSKEAQNLSTYVPTDLGEGSQPEADFSRRDPKPGSPFWAATSLSSIRDVEEFYYRKGSQLHQGLTHAFPESPAGSNKVPSVDFIEILPALPGTPHPAPQLSAYFVGTDGAQHAVRVKFRSKVHADPTVSALATLLGYSTPVFKHYPELKVYLRDTSLRQFKIDFLDQLSPENIAASLEMDPNIVGIGQDRRGEFIHFREVLVEAIPNELLELGTWESTALGHDQLREVRAFELFQLWVGNIEAGAASHTRMVIRQDSSGLSVHSSLRDLGGSLGGLVPETPAALPWTLIRSLSFDQVDFTQRSAIPNPLRGKITESDGIWATRLIGRLSKNQIEQAVRLGAWPEPVDRLLVEKLSHRRNQLVKAFGLESELGLLQADPSLTTPDGKIVNGHLTQSRFEGSIHEYDHEGPRLRDARLAALKIAAARLIQLGTHTIGFTELSEFELGSTVGLISEGLIKLDREVEQNPNPRDESERFLVQDVIKVGLRLGAGFIISGQATLWHQYKLVYPVRTEAEAIAAGNFAVNLLMPYQLWKGDLPERFVLMTESAIEGGGRVNLGIPGVLPIHLDTSHGLLTLARSTLERTAEGNFKVFKDREISLHSQYRILGEVLGLFRVPLIQREDHHGGKLEGKVWNIPFEALFSSNDFSSELSQALLEVVRLGGTQKLEAITEHPESQFRPLELKGSFSRSSVQWSWAGIISGNKTFEFLRAWGEALQKRDQYRTSNEKHWGLLDWSEDHSVRAELISTEQSHSRLKIRWKIDDHDTSTEELEDGYLVLLNRLAGEHAVTLKPGLFSRNQKWSRTLTHIEIDYGMEALQRLQTLTPEAYWKALAEVLNISDQEIQRLRQAKDLVLVQRRGRRAVPTQITPEARAVSESKDFVSKLWGWSGNQDWDWGRFMKTLNRTFRDGHLTQRSWIIQTLNHFIGKQNIRFSARISPPYGAEALFPGNQAIEYRREFAALSSQSTAALAEAALDPLLIFAETPLELYRFFDAFSEISANRQKL